VPQIRAGEYEGLAEKVSAWRIKLEVLIKLKATTSLKILAYIMACLQSIRELSY